MKGSSVALLLLWATACRPSPGARLPDEPARDPAGEAADEPARAPSGEQLPDLADRFAWLQGVWVAEGDGRRESETWVTQGEALFGTSESRVGDAVVHREEIVIERRGDAIVYEARPSSQAPHAFTLVEDAPGRARFEDPAHDWPQAIEYVRQGDTLTATVSGTKDGTVRTATWTWTLSSGWPPE